jgi:hypothetical protein
MPTTPGQDRGLCVESGVLLEEDEQSCEGYRANDPENSCEDPWVASRSIVCTRAVGIETDHDGWARRPLHPRGSHESISGLPRRVRGLGGLNRGCERDRSRDPASFVSRVRAIDRGS